MLEQQKHVLFTQGVMWQRIVSSIRAPRVVAATLLHNVCVNSTGASCRCDLSLPVYRHQRVLEILETVAAVSLTPFQFYQPNVQAAYF